MFVCISRELSPESGRGPDEQQLTRRGAGFRGGAGIARLLRGALGDPGFFPSFTPRA